MYLSKRSNGFYYIFYENRFSKKTCISTKSKLKNEALKFLSDFKSKVTERERNKIPLLPLDLFLKEYLKHSELIHSRNTTKSIISTVNSLNNYFGAITINELNRKRISDYIDHRIKSTSLFVAKREIAYLSGIFNWAISEKYLFDNYAKNIKKIRLPEKQPMFFSETDFEILLRVIDSPDLRDLIIFAVNCGLRQMELLTLEWNQINFRDRVLVLGNRNHVTKSKKVRAIPLSIKAMQILTEREIKKTGESIFTYNGEPIKQDFISKKFRKYVKKANLNPLLNFHSLRSTFASWLIQRGASIHSVSKLLGHCSIRITETHYAFLRPDDLTESINRLNN